MVFLARILSPSFQSDCLHFSLNGVLCTRIKFVDVDVYVASYVVHALMCVCVYVRVRACARGVGGLVI